MISDYSYVQVDILGRFVSVTGGGAKHDLAIASVLALRLRIVRWRSNSDAHASSGLIPKALLRSFQIWGYSYVTVNALQSVDAKGHTYISTFNRCVSMCDGAFI